MGGWGWEGGMGGRWEGRVTNTSKGWRKCKKEKGRDGKDGKGEPCMVHLASRWIMSPLVLHTDILLDSVDSTRELPSAPSINDFLLGPRSAPAEFTEVVAAGLTHRSVNPLLFASR